MSDAPQLKPISKAALPAALAKAERYRFLGEPRQAESICLDVLGVDPGNQKALVGLVLAISDQLERREDTGVAAAREALARVQDPYARAYFEGIVYERRAYAVLRARRPGSQFAAYDWLQRALERYGEAERLRPADNDDPILRWNTVVRMLERHPEIRSEPEPTGIELGLE